MKFNYIGNIKKGQDGAIWDKYLFRFEGDGTCFVYNIDGIENNVQDTIPEYSTFMLDKAQILAPHSNSVTFSNKYYDSNDEFPLLYTNIYNNYAACEDRLVGVCCVYRITRDGNKFSSKLVQMIRIGFTEDSSLWCSMDNLDVRPYGNFAVDRDNDKLYAFTMRDSENSTRYFSFDLPKIEDGVIDEKYGVKLLVLFKEDIKEYFDCEYHRFLQGACVHNGLVYSVEGFSGGSVNPPVLRIADFKNHALKQTVSLEEYGLISEPEFIDFRNGICFYSDNKGKLYTIDFDD